MAMAVGEYSTFDSLSTLCLKATNLQLVGLLRNGMLIRLQRLHDLCLNISTFQSEDSVTAVLVAQTTVLAFLATKGELLKTFHFQDRGYSMEHNNFSFSDDLLA